MKRILAVLFLLAAAVPAYAVNPDEMLDDPKLEARAREISEHLRCLVCQNESIDDSNADLAHDLRVLVRDRLKAGDTNEQTIDYIVDRYGEFVLLKPRFSARNLILWGAPLIVLVLGAAGIGYRVVSSRGKSGGVKLTEEEERRLSRILAEGEGSET